MKTFCVRFVKPLTFQQTLFGSDIFSHNVPTDRAGELTEPSKGAEGLAVSMLKEQGNFGFESFVGGVRRYVASPSRRQILRKKFKIRMYVFYSFKITLAKIWIIRALDRPCCVSGWQVMAHQELVLIRNV